MKKLLSTLSPFVFIVLVILCTVLGLKYSSAQERYQDMQQEVIFQKGEKHQVIEDMNQLYKDYQVAEIEEAERLFAEILVKKQEIELLRSIRDEVISKINNPPVHLFDSNLRVVSDLGNGVFDAYIEESE